MLTDIIVLIVTSLFWIGRCCELSVWNKNGQLAKLSVYPTIFIISLLGFAMGVLTHDILDHATGKIIPKVEQTK